MPETEANRQLVISSIAQAQALSDELRDSARAACRSLSEMIAESQPLEVLRALKFRQVGFDPLDASRPLNLLEQVHQTFAYLASVRGVAYLLERHPDRAPFHVTLGASTGPDIQSADGRVVAETLAVVTPVNNNKLKYDIERMRSSTAAVRYVFYYAEEDHGAVSGEVSGTDVQVIPVTI